MERKIIGICLLSSIGLMLLKGIVWESTSTITYSSPVEKAFSLTLGLLLIVFSIYGGVLLVKRNK